MPPKVLTRDNSWRPRVLFDERNAMKPRKRWSWFFGGEPEKPLKKRRRPRNHGVHGHSDDRFAARISSRQRSDNGNPLFDGATRQSSSEASSAANRSPKRLRLEGEHDFYVTNDTASGSMILRACRMRGFSEFLSVDVANESGSNSTPKWLILEHSDGRLIYIRSDRVWYIEETSKTTA